MAYVNYRVIEGVFSEEDKVELAKRITQAFAEVAREPRRVLTWDLIDGIASGELTIGGRPITTAGVRGVVPGAPAGV